MDAYQFSNVERALPRLKKVCFYSVSTHLGGAERSLLDLVRELKSRFTNEFSPWVIVPKAEGLLLEEFQKLGIEYVVITMPGNLLDLSRKNPWRLIQSIYPLMRSLLSYINDLRSVLLSSKTDLIHSSGIKCHLFSALACIGLKIPIIWHLRDMMDSKFVSFLLRLVLKLNQNVTLMSNSEATARSFQVAHKKNQVIHNGVDLRSFQTKKDSWFQDQFHFPKDLPVVGIVGALAKWKGQELFLKMAKRIIDEKVEARFVIVGAEIYDTEAERGFTLKLKQDVEKMNLNSYVFFAGFVKESHRVYNNLDILVHASLKPEPFGRVIIEAMASGVPVVASGAGGVLEIVTHGETGLLFPPGDLTALTESVLRILHQTNLRSKLSEHAHQHVTQHFSLSRQVNRVVGRYYEILDGG